MMADETLLRPVRGKVKWFDPGKGYGFVVADEGGPDILLHANVLRNYGQNSVSEGVEICVTVQQTPRGVQAAEVVEIAVPAIAEPVPIPDLAGIDPDEIAAQPLRPARVKWFDKAKGFGFANTFGCGDDIFIHIEVLRRSGFADLQPGEAVGLRVMSGRRGWMAVHVMAWEAAARAD